MNSFHVSYKGLKFLFLAFCFVVPVTHLEICYQAVLLQIADFQLNLCELEHAQTTA